jgi:hypothetical protein
MLLKDILARQADLRNRISIGNLVLRLLNETYVGSIDQPAGDKVVNDDGTTVPEEAIKDFCQYFQDNFIAPSRVELEKLSSLDLVDLFIERVQRDPDILPYAQLKKTKEK